MENRKKYYSKQYFRQVKVGESRAISDTVQLKCCKMI